MSNTTPTPQAIYTADCYVPGTDADMVEFRAVLVGDTVTRLTAYHYNGDNLMVEDADGDRARVLVAQVLCCNPEHVEAAILAAYREELADALSPNGTTENES